jgi:hypothetical protein
MQMSRVSRARRASRGKQPATPDRRPGLVVAPDPEQPCDCPACSGGLDPEQLFAELVDGAAGLSACEDPLEAELTGALFVALATMGGEALPAGSSRALIPAVEAQGGDTSLALLTAITAAAAAGPELVARAAADAAARLIERRPSGVPRRTGRSSTSSG